jgi:RNA polymerase sigma factor (sigma-70 family)
MEKDELDSELGKLHADSYGWALACCGRDREEAEEVLQNAYLKVFTGKAQFDGRSSLRTWLFGVIRRTAAEERRRNIVRRVRAAAYAVIAPSEIGAEAETTFDIAQRHERLLSALRELSPRQREVLQLVFYHDMTIEDAASVMSVSLGTARTHYERGKARLLEKLAGDADDAA